jgi:hypothetical protein
MRLQSKNSRKAKKLNARRRSLQGWYRRQLCRAFEVPYELVFGKPPRKETT